MLSLRNKTAAKLSGAPELAWHLDFRQMDRLPDTKTVRTKFFVNVVAIAITSALLLYVGYGEWRMASLRSDLVSIEAQIGQIKPASEAAVKTYKLFQVEEKRFSDAYALLDGGFDYLAFMVNLGSILPPGIVISRIDYRGPGSGMTMAATLKGLDADASDRVAEFVAKLQQNAYNKNIFNSISLTNLVRNVSDGALVFELMFTFRTSVGAVKSSSPVKK